MSEKNIQIKQRNADNTGWEDLYPKTLGEIVVTQDGKTVEEHVNDKDIHVSSSEKSKWNAKATTQYVDSKISALVNSAPETLDTLHELSTALGNDPDFATTISKQIGSKFDKANVDNDVNLGNNDTKVPSQKAVKSYVDKLIAGTGKGDMLKATYDTNGNGKVDVSEFAERARIETSSAKSEPASTKAGEIWFATL